MKPNSNLLSGWTAKGDVQVNLSTHHEEMYIVTQPDGKFHTIRSSEKDMMHMHPMKSNQLTIRK